MWRSLCIACLYLLLSAPERPAIAETDMVPWTTRSADNARSGWNPRETELTADRVRKSGLVRSAIIPVIGDARGMEAQPLILPKVRTALGVRDVMILPSMANVIRAVDARDGSGIWQVALGKPVTGSQSIDMHMINDHWGCLSTGVIDPDTERLYQSCWVSQDGAGDPQTARWFVFVLNVPDGSSAVAPVMIAGSSHGQDFNAGMRKQRSSLVETNVNGVKTIFGCAGTVFETNPGASGYCFAFDVATNSVSAMLALTAGRGAGVWMGGQGIIADPSGYLYVMTGNGDFDGVSQWGESFLKLKYDPPADGRTASLTVVDHWTPWTDLARTGQAPAPMEKMSGMSAPSEALKVPSGSRAMSMAMANARLVATFNSRGAPTLLVYPEMDQGRWADQDWGSAGPACLFALDVCVAAGKDGIGYPIKMSNLGGTTPADLANAKSNCAKLAAPPVWLTVDPGAVDPCPNDPRELNFLTLGYTAHLHMTPVQFFDPVLRSWTIFAWGENAALRKWAIGPTGALTFVAESHELASSDDFGEPPGGMPGGFCSGSSNGADPDSAILVCSIPYGDGNANIVDGRLLIFDPVHTAGDGALQVLWDSRQNGISFAFNKFDPPVIDGGQIYVPNYRGGVDMYRLAR